MLTAKNKKDIKALLKIDSRQRVFAVTYAVTNSVKQAAASITPEISVSEAYQWLNNATIRLLVEAVHEEQQHVSLISNRMLEAMWLETLPKLMGEEAISLGVDRDGIQREGYEFNAPALINLFKEMRAYIKDQEVDPTIADAPPLEINFSVKQATRDLKITRSDDDNSNT